MTYPVPRDRELLSHASIALKEAVELLGLEASANSHLRLLEGAAAHIGGYDLKRFDDAVGYDSEPNGLTASDTTLFSRRLAEAIHDSSLPPSLALASLGDSDLDPVVRRRQGRYFTDTRLALSLAEGVRGQAAGSISILDPACGAGVLLVAVVLQVTSNAAGRAHFVHRVLWGVDRDIRAVRAARAAIASLTDDVGAISRLSQRLLVADSLAVGQAWWHDLVPSGFDLVIANPPWEKLRVTRHEHALLNGYRRYYGDSYRTREIDEEALLQDRQANAEYRKRVSTELVYQGPGESDLYKMFLELGAKLASSSGALAFLVPAGLIRNYGARRLREWLLSKFDTTIVIVDNRERFFHIDSRFKFVQFFARPRDSEESRVSFGRTPGTLRASGPPITTCLSELRQIQPDLALPEVKDSVDWALFSRITLTHPRFGENDSGWKASFYREVDMTNDRPRFVRSSITRSHIPVIEGRMVHHHRIAAKRYVAGTGRRAEWRVQPPFQAALQPQWYIDVADLHPRVRERIEHTRAGFCDITGQTNERTVLAALVPDSVACGNKVPTLDLRSHVHAEAWVGIANSFVFDWLARRSVTTTLNFFILRSLPIPAWDNNEDLLVEIAGLSQTLAGLEKPSVSCDLWTFAYLRAGIEVLTARSYGVSVADLDQMLGDFPQVDRAQPPIRGEEHSTVTRDLIIASGDGWASIKEVNHAIDRVTQAKAAGATPFTPNQHARAYRSLL